MSSGCHQHGAGMWRLRVSCRGASSVNLHGGGSRGTARRQRMERTSSSGTRTLSQARSAVNAGVPREVAVASGDCPARWSLPGSPALPHSFAASSRRSARNTATSLRLLSPCCRATACTCATTESSASLSLGHRGSGDCAFLLPPAGDAGLEAGGPFSLLTATARAARSPR